MNSASRPRRLRRAVLLTGGAVGAVGAAGSASLVGLIMAESKLARRRIPQATEPPPVSHDTTWTAAGVSPRRAPIRIAVLGDSTAAGYGVDHDRETPAAQLAVGISEAARRPVHVRNVGVVGASSSDLPDQLANLGQPQLDVAFIMIGANDVTARTPPEKAVAPLARVVEALVERRVEVVVGTCPDLGTVRPLSQPLRAYARRLSRRLAAAQTVAVIGAGGRTVSLGDLIGPLFASRLDMFAADRFHPSAAGYAEAANAMLPSALDALGLRTRARAAGPFTTRRTKPVAVAAAQAVARPGSEVAAAERFGRAENRRGDFARLRRRLPSHSLLRPWRVPAS